MKRMTARFGLKLNEFIIAAALIILLFAVTANAQLVIGPNQGTKPSGNEPGIGTVNPYNGNLTLSIPLFRIGGRGEAGYTISHTFVQNWSFYQTINFWQCNIIPQCDVSSTFQPSLNSEPGEPSLSGYGAQVTRPGYTPGVMIGRHAASYRWGNVNYSSTWNSYLHNQSVALMSSILPYSAQSTPWATHILNSITRLSFVMNDGSEIELRDVQSQGQPQVERTCAQGGYNRGKLFAAADGSGTVFESDQDILDWDCSNADPYGVGAPATFKQTFNPSGYLRTGKGVTYRIDGGSVAWIRDRNGNKITFSGNTVTDSLGRQVSFSANGITFAGFGGQSKSIAIHRDSLSSALGSGYSIKTKAELFGPLGINTMSGNDNDQVNPDVVTSIELPDGREYRFYYNSYAELARIENPNGGAVEYDIGPGFTASSGVFGATTGVLQSQTTQRQVYRRVLESRTYPNGGTGYGYETRTTYSRDSLTNQTGTVTVESRDNADNLLAKTKHYYYGNVISSFFDSYVNPSYSGPFSQGKEYKTDVFSSSGTVAQRTELLWANNTPVGWWAAFCDYQSPCLEQEPANNPVVTRVTTTLADSNQVAKREMAYDQFGNQTDLYEYDYGTGSPGAFRRRTHTDYIDSAAYTAATGPTLRQLPWRKWVSGDIDGNQKASMTTIEYDSYSSNPLEPRSNVFGHDTTVYGSSFTTRGNPTKVTSLADVSDAGSGVTVTTKYDILGNAIAVTDANLNTSTVDFTDNFGSPDFEAQQNSAPAELGGMQTFAFPRSATNAMGWIIGYTQYDYFTGAVVNSEDINGVITKIRYDDPLGRPTQTVTAVGTDFVRQATTVYDDSGHGLETRADLFELNDNLARSVIFYDGFRRTTESRKIEADGYVSVKTEYDALGRVKRVTNPYRPLLNETEYWTTTSYDRLSRILEVRTPDNAVTTTAYFGSATTVTDQAGASRRSITDALGRLTRVDEPNAAGNLGDIAAPNQPTYYQYDPVDNLTEVTQTGTTAEQCGASTVPCAQTRSFVYNALSRLVSVTNPESGTIQYAYDPSGNLTSKTDARNITSAHSYDPINRVTLRNYSDSTNDVSFTYDDPSVAYSKGNLTKTDNGFSKTEVTEFDKLGRVKKSRQTTDGTAYNEMEYKYNLSGAMVEQKYPSGRVVKSVLDNDGDLSMVQSKRNANYGFWNYAHHFNYTAAGAVSSMQLGNGTWEKTMFNSRLQPTQIALGKVQNTTDLLQLDYTYGVVESSTLNTAKNNGNIQSQPITVPNITGSNGFTAVQTYSYDSLNRIDDATEMVTPAGSTTATLSWRQDYSFDRFGNRNFVEANTTTIPRNCLDNQTPPNPVICDVDWKIFNPSVNAANNRLSSADGYQFDAAGNTIRDPHNRKFTYDAENKQTKVESVDTNGNVTGTIGEYFYDGDGRRVKKIAYTNNQVSETTVFVYDASSRLVAEYSTNSSETPQVAYLTNDHLGSPRINTDENGKVTARHDYRPYGEEVTERTHAEYVGDTIRMQFTAKERDRELGIDYFLARLYVSTRGRFQTADNVSYSKTEDAQTWNQYIYCRNGPITRLDPDGHNWFYFNNKWVWKDGQYAWEYYTNKAGKTKRRIVFSPYEFLVEVRIDYSNPTVNGGYYTTTTLYGSGYDDVRAIDRNGYSGSPGPGNSPVPDGQYFINIGNLGYQSTQSAFEEKPGRLALAAYRDGMQLIGPFEQSIRGRTVRIDMRSVWGSVRANLSKAGFDESGQPVFQFGNSTSYYVHGHSNSRGRATNGCVGTPDERVLNYLLKLRETTPAERDKNVVPVNVTSRSQ